MDNSNPQQGTTNTTNAKAPPSSSVTNKRRYNATVKDDRKIFVGGLRQTLSHEQFKAFFETYGTVIDSVVMTHPDTKCSRGFGFVTFESAAVAQKVLASGNVDEEGAPLPAPTGGWTSGKVWIFDKECEVKASIPKRSAGGRWKNACKETKEVSELVSTSQSATATVSSESSTPSFVEVPTVNVSSDEKMESEGHPNGQTNQPNVVPPPPHYPQPYPMMVGYQGAVAYPPDQGWVPNLVPVLPYPMAYNPYGGFYAPQPEHSYNEYGYAYGCDMNGFQGGPVAYGQPPLPYTEPGFDGHQEDFVGGHGGIIGSDGRDCQGDKES